MSQPAAATAPDRSTMPAPSPRPRLPAVVGGWQPPVPASIVVLAERAAATVLFPIRAMTAFGNASVGVSQLVQPDGPVRLVYLLSAVTAPDRPLGKALQTGGIVDRVLDDHGVLARLSQPGGVLDRFIAPGGLVDRLLATDGPVDRIIEPGGALDRLLANEGAIDRMLAPDGVLDRLLAREGLIEQLVSEDGIIDRLGGLMKNIDRLGPVLESLERVVDGVHASVGQIDESVRGVDVSLAELVTLLEPVADVVGRLPGQRKRMAARQVPPPSPS